MSVREQCTAIRGSASLLGSVLCDRVNSNIPAAGPAPVARAQGPSRASGSFPCLHIPRPQLDIAPPTQSLLALRAPAAAAGSSAAPELCSPNAGPTTPPTSNLPAAAATPFPGRAADSGAAGGTTTSTGPLPTAAAKAAAVVALWRRVQSFMRVLLSSPLVMSALLALELEGTHPVQAHSGAHGLKWTLAQMLALHLKAGYATASETQLLATLWTLESWDNVWRSPCTAALQSYLQHLTAFDAKRAMGMSDDWPKQFRSLRRAMSDSQLDLLKKLDWRVRLDFEMEVAPCRSLLFKLPQAPATPTQLSQGCASALPPVAGAGSQGTSASCVREEWVQRMEALCSLIHRRAEEVAAAGGADVDIDLAAAEEEAPLPPSPPKRQRLLG